jgi:hypothetical protein
MDEHHRYALEHPCRTHNAIVNPKFHWGVVGGPWLFLSLHLTVNDGLDDAGLFDGRPLWHVSGALYSHPRAAMARLLRQWTADERRVVAEAMTGALDGAGDASPLDQWEDGTISLSLRRPLTLAEQAQLRRPGSAGKALRI